MQHKCTVCGRVYARGSEEILNGCMCGNKLFYFVRGKKQKKQATEIPETFQKNKEFSSRDSRQQEYTKTELSASAVPVADTTYFYELEDDANNELIIFDVEAVRIASPGKYTLDIAALFNNKGIVYGYGDGKYGIDILGNMDLPEKKKKR